MHTRRFYLNNFKLNLIRQFATYKGVDYTPIIMPKLSPTADESKVGEWLVKEGDFIESGDSYCNVETDKAMVSHDALEEGYIAKLFKTDEKVKINSLIGVQVENKEDIEKFADFTPEKHNENGSPAEPKEKEAEGKKDVEEKSKETDEKIGAPTETTAKHEIKDSNREFATPAARKKAQMEGIDISNIEKTGRAGSDKVATLKDVLKSKPQPISPKLPQPSSEQNYVDIPLTAMRETIAKRLLESKQTIPHFSVSMRVLMDRALQFRAELNKEEDVKISVNDLIVKASALALKKVPEVNSSWQENFIRTYANADISVAVSTPTGLLTPIVKSANLSGLNEISHKVKDLATRAREGTLKPEEFIGGTFTISNLGMMGVSEFSAIINPPQAAILAVGGTMDEFYFDSANNQSSRKVMNVTLSCDHRVVDGAKAAEWLVAFRKLLQKPETMAL